MSAALQLVDFVLAKKQRHVLKFFDEFSRPSVVRIVQVETEYELSAPRFAKNAQFWVFDKHRQKRILFRSTTTDRYISIALDSPAMFHIVHRHTVGPASTLKEIFKNTRNVGDLKVALDNDRELMLSNRPDLNNGTAYGELTAVAIFEETCLVSQAMNGSTLESRLTLISTKAPLVLDSVVGIRKRSSSYFRQWTDALSQQQIHPSPSHFASTSENDLIVLCGGDDCQHSSILCSVRKDLKGVTNSRHSQATATQLESKNNGSSGDGSTALDVYQAVVARSKRPDIDSLRKRFETTEEKTEENHQDARGAYHRPGLPQASRSSSERTTATLPSSVSNIRMQPKSRSMSREDLLHASQSNPDERIVLDQIHTRSLANALGIVDESSPTPVPPPPSSTSCDSNDDKDTGYESIRFMSSLAPSSVHTAQNSKCATSENRATRPSAPDPPQSKSKALGRLGIGKRQKEAKKVPPPPTLPGQYERINRAETEEHEYCEVTDLESASSSGRISVAVEKGRKWKCASDIPRDLNVASLTVDEVARCLELLKLRKYARKFKDRVVDGAVLVTVTEAMLIESFRMDQIDARKLVMFAREDWRPAK